MPERPTPSIIDRQIDKAKKARIQQELIGEHASRLTQKTTDLILGTVEDPYPIQESRVGVDRGQFAVSYIVTNDGEEVEVRINADSYPREESPFYSPFIVKAGEDLYVIGKHTLLHDATFNEEDLRDVDELLDSLGEGVKVGEIRVVEYKQNTDINVAPIGILVPVVG